MPKRRHSSAPIGLIGLGLMGNAMAERLIKSKHEVVGYDISRAACRGFIKLKGQLARGGTEILQRCDRVLLSLPSSRITRQVLREVAGSFRYGHVIIDTSTGDPADAQEFSTRLSPFGALYVDATVSGNSTQLRRGDVVALVGGSRHGFNRCAPLLKTFAKRIIHTGPVGSGAQMKLVTNLVLGLNRAALAEGLAFARLLGLDGVDTLRILRESMAYSRIMDTKGEKMLRNDFRPQARLSQHLKDVRLMLAASRKCRARLPLTEVHGKILRLAEKAGLGGLDNSAIIKVIAQTNAKPRPNFTSVSRRER